MSMIKNISLLLVCVVFLICTCKNVAGTAKDSKFMTTHRENMNDTGKSFVEYTCTAEMDHFNRLSWYKIKGPNHRLLNMTQQHDKGRRNKTVTLYMTLENSDRNSEIYCAKENRTEQRLFYTEIIRWIQLSFNRTIPPLEKAHASIEPNSKIVYYDTEQVLKFVCKGTAPTDGRKLRWYLENYDHSEQQSDEIFITPQWDIAESQKYDSEKNEAVLQLTLSMSHHLKRLFCAQDIHFQLIENNGKNGIRFAQRVRSKTVTLILRDSVGLLSEPEEAFDGGKDKETIIMYRKTNDVLWWSVAIVMALALILLIALVVIIKKWKKTEAEFEEMERLWNRPPLQVRNENDYDTVYSHGAGLLRRPEE